MGLRDRRGPPGPPGVGIPGPQGPPGTTDHHLLLNLTDGDDHPQYLKLTGRTGGQTAQGGTANADNLVLKANSGVSPTGQVVVDLLTSDTETLHFKGFATPTTQNYITINADGVTRTLNTGGVFKVLGVYGAMNLSNVPANAPFQVFVFQPNIVVAAAGLVLKGPRIFRAAPTVTLTDGLAAGSISAGGTPVRVYDTLWRYNQSPAATGTATVSTHEGFGVQDTVQTGWTIDFYRGFRIVTPAGTGVINNLHGIEFDDYGARAADTVSLRSLGALVEMRHRGRAVFGAATPVGAGAALEVVSSTGFFRLPRMSTAQRDLIAAAVGDLLYNVTTAQYEKCTVAGTPGTFVAF